MHLGGRGDRTLEWRKQREIRMTLDDTDCRLPSALQNNACLAALNRVFHKVLLPYSAVVRGQSRIAMNQFKADAALPM
jgi:hypothetical protein